jgi:hypothetical protein
MSLGIPKENQFEIVPADTHTALGYRVIDLGTQQIEWQGQVKHQHKILLSWELDCLMEDGENAGKPFSIHKRYTYTWSEKGSLRADLESWRGRPFTEEEMNNFKLKNLLGAPCLIGVVHNKKDGKTYANISSIMKLPKGMTAPKPVNPTVDFDLGDFNQAVYDSFSDNLKQTIAKSPEYQKLKIKSYEQEPIDTESKPEIRSTILSDDEIPF